MSGPPFEPLAGASFRNKTRKALFLLAMATAKRVGELQALSFSVSHRGDDLVLHYDLFFLAKTESVSNPLPRSVIVQSLEDFVGDLPERVFCPVRAVRYLRRAARSPGFTPNRLFVSPSDPKRSMSKNAMPFFLRQLITESGAVSSSVPPRAHDIRGIATSLNYYSNLSLSAISDNSLLPSVSRTERVSDSPCLGKAFKVNSQVYDLMSSKPSESRSVPLSVKEAAGLETTLRSMMESYNFQLWTVTALFRLLGDSGRCSLDDPLLDQFQRSFSRGPENVAASMASAAAFVTTKRRESFLSHMVPSVTDAQKRKLLSDPLFHQKDLFAPASIEAAREAAGDVSLYRGAQSRPSTSSGTTHRRSFSSSSSSRGRPHSSPLSPPQRSPASSSSRRFQPKKKSSDSPKNRGGFRR